MEVGSDENVDGCRVFFAGLPAGCSGPAQKVEPDRALPFIVRLRAVELQEPTAEERAAAATPADFGDPKEFTRKLKDAIEETGLFTGVFLAGEADALADLDLEIVVNDHDFGPGKARFDGAIYSTLAWLFGGPASWVIDDREYPESRVSMSVELREPAQQAEDPIFNDELFVDGLQSSFLERGDTGNWFLGILIPPWVGDGDVEKAGASLAARCSGFFVAQELPRILSFFPADYVRRTGCFLSYKADDDALVIVSERTLVRVTIRGRSAPPRTLTDALVGEYRVDDLEEKEDLRRWLRDRVAGLATVKGADRYVRIPLEEIGFGREEALIRVEALLEEPLQEEKPPVRWTIWRETGREE